MSDAQHTQTPWKACGANSGDCECGLIWAESVDQCVMTAHCVTCDVLDHGDVAPPVRVMKANVRLVVRAVNSHYDLLAACELAVIACRENLAEANHKNEPLLLNALDACQAAVSKAKGGLK